MQKSGRDVRTPPNIRSEVSGFFQGVFHAPVYKDVKYKVVLSRGCAILYETFLTEGGRTGDPTVMSDSGLLLRIKEIVQFYMEHRSFPPILLMDDIAVHGRTLNTFLQCLEEQIFTQFQAMENGHISEEIENRYDLRRSLSSALHIEVFAHLDTPLPSLHVEYRSNCYTVDPGPGISTIRKLRQKARDIAEYVYKADVVNASYTMSAKLNRDGSMGKIWRFLTQKNGFSAESYTQDGNAMNVFQKCFPKKDCPKAVATIRILTYKNSRWVVPYIFSADLVNSDFKQLVKQLDQMFPELSFRGLKLAEMVSCGRIQCELAAMMMNHLFLQYVLDGSDLSAADYTFDAEKLIRSFGGDSESSRFLGAFIKLSRERAGSCFPTLCRFLIRKIRKPFSRGSEPGKSLNIQATMDVVKDYIYTRSVNAERVLYYSDQGRLTSSMIAVGQKSICVSSFLTQLHDFASEQDISLNNQHIFTCLLHCMDRGYVATIAREVNNQRYYSHCVRVGEVSLSIHPERYKEYISLLLTMELYCLWGWQDMEWKLEKYFSDYLGEPELAKKLWLFVRSIHRSGQSLLDWADSSDIDNEKDENTRKYKKWKGLS